MRVVTASESVIRAHLVILSLSIGFILTALFFVKGENDNFDFLLGSSVADELDGEFFIAPVLTGQAIEDGTGVAVILSKAFRKHAQEKLLGKELELTCVNIFVSLLLALLRLLLFLVFSDGLLKLDLLIFEILGGLVSHRMATLLPEVDKLVETDKATLMLLSKEVSSSGSARANWTKKDHIQLLLLLESRRHLDLLLVVEHFSELGLKLTLDSGEGVASLTHLLLCLARLLELGPVISFFVLRVLLTISHGAKVFGDLLLHGIVLLNANLSLLDLTLELLDLTLVIILLLD